MRAIFNKDLKFENGSGILNSEQVHHLVNVVRVKQGEKLLVLNGDGKKVYCIIKSINKKSIELEVTSEEIMNDERFIDLLIAPPKKDAFFEILKNAIEMNVRNIYLIDSQYSQRLKIHDDKIKKILIGAYEQSNYAFETKVYAATPFDKMELLCENYNQIYYFSTLGGAPRSPMAKLSGPVLILIGPEGGFSPEENQFICKQSKVIAIQFKTNIMRSQTAVSAAMGHLQSS